MTRYADMSRRAAMTAAALAAMATLAGCGGSVASAEGDMALGAPESSAKVTVVEYASVTCPHCAAWQTTTYPAFKARYVDTNKVRYVFREMPTNPENIAQAGFLIARCTGTTEGYFKVIHEIMASQEEYVTGATSPHDLLYRIGNGAGLNNQRIDACLKDEKAIKAMDDRVKAARKAGVTGTPTFFVNGEQVITPGAEGPSMADLSRVIDADLAKN